MDSRPSTHQKPLSYIILICAVLLLVIVLGMYMVKSSTTNSKTTPKTLTTNTCTQDEAMCAFLEKVADKDKYYTMPITATISISTINSATPTGQVVLQADTKNNVYVTSSESGKIQGELLLVNDTLYKKNLVKGNWQKQNSLNTQAFIEFRQKALNEIKVPNEKIAYTLIGKETCGSQTCFVYQFINAERSSIKETIYFDTNDYLLRKLVSQTANGTTTETSFSYNDLTITPPANI